MSAKPRFLPPVLAILLAAVQIASAQQPPAAPSRMPFAISLPPGFKIELISARIGPARFLAVAPNGDVLVSQISRGRVIALSPRAGPDAEPRVVAEGLERPNGLEFRGSDLYIATWTGVAVIPDYPRGSGTRRVLFSDLPRNGGHNARALAIAADGSVFVSVGSDCNVCTESDRRLATVFRYAADGSSGRIYASGLRNASGLAFDSFGRLWAVVNQRDNLLPDHRDLPPDELDLIVEGGDYGWPSAYPSGGRRLPNPEYPKARTDAFLPADFELQAHSAPLQAAFYGGTLFPSEYRGTLFVALHGSWNRDPPTGYKVVAISFRDGRPVSVSDFATGWLAGGKVMGRPVGLAFAADGSMYVSDDTGYLFRITLR
jgi:glucose/arabinose dehydrogenase